MLRAVARPLVSVVERWMPDALVFAIGLTFVVALMALGLTDAGPLEIVRGWGDGLSGLLEFIAQIAIVLVLGYTLAHTRPIHRMLNSIAYGDQWTNMIQPFWTIPLLAIAGLSVRDILGCTTITLFVSGAVMLTTLFLVGAF